MQQGRSAPWIAFALGLGIAGCGPREPSPAAPARDGPVVHVLGTVQDGGLPHASCRCDRCRAARSDPRRTRRVASLGLQLADGRLLLVDATPDLRPQLERIRDLRGESAPGVDRSPVDGVLLSHAHIGHYLGLAFFGYEAVHTRDLAVHCSPAMAAFLRENEPWGRLVEVGNIRLHELHPGRVLETGGGLRIEPLAVPHRDELSDTLGFMVRGPSASLLYVPDTDAWEAWDPPIERFVDAVDVALLDGTFFSSAELPGRDVSSIGHPLIRDTMDRLQPVVRRGRTRVYFTHLNHSNPALDPHSSERTAIERRGFAILEEGQSFPL